VKRLSDCITCGEKHSEVVMHFDGGVRQGVCAYGWCFTNPCDKNHLIAYGHRTCGKGTSNISEYRALLAGLSACKRIGIKTVHIVGDSQLVVRQVTGVYQVRKEELRKLCHRIQKMLKEIPEYTIKWVPRNENKQADALVNAVFERRNDNVPNTNANKNTQIRGHNPDPTLGCHAGVRSQSRHSGGSK